MAKLNTLHLERFSDAQPGSLRHRVKDWRGVMTKRLVYAASDDHSVKQRYKGEISFGRNGSQWLEFRQHILVRRQADKGS